MFPVPWHWSFRLSRSRPTRALPKCLHPLSKFRRVPAMPRDWTTLMSGRVGIVYLVNGELIIDSTPVGEAEPWGDFRNHALSHEKYWAGLQADGRVPAEIEYEDPPRG